MGDILSYAVYINYSWKHKKFNCGTARESVPFVPFHLLAFEWVAPSHPAPVLSIGNTRMKSDASAVDIKLI